MSDTQVQESAQEAVKALREALLRDGVSISVVNQAVTVFEVHLHAVAGAERNRISAMVAPVLLEAENMILRDTVAMVERGLAAIREKLAGQR